MVSIKSGQGFLVRFQKWIDKESIFSEVVVLALVFSCIWYIQPFIYLPLSSDFYQESTVLFFEYFLVNRLSLVVGCLIIGYTCFISFYRKGASWSLIPKWLKVIVITCVLLLAWAYGFTETNYFYDKAYLVDKVLLLILAFLAIIRPQFTFLFLLQAYLLSKQFGYALPSPYTFTDKQIVYDILFGFSLFLALKFTFLKSISWNLFLVVVLLILCNWYFKAGLGKIIVGWQNHNALYNLFMASVAHDWLYQFPQLKNWIGTSLLEMKGIIEYITLFVEFLFPLILLVKRSWFKYIMGSFIVFHLLVYLTSGIFFWKWIVLEVILIITSFKWSGMLRFSFRQKAIYIGALVLFYFASPTTSLVWYDTPFLQKFEFYLVDEAEEKKLDASFFSPFDVVFAQNRFSFINQRPTYTRTYGATTNLKTLFDANDAVKNNGIPNFDSAEVVDYDMDKEEALICFIQQFVFNKLNGDVKWVNWVDAPMHIHQGQNQQNFEAFVKADTLKVVYKELLTLSNLTFKEIYRDERMIQLQKSCVAY